MLTSTRRTSTRTPWSGPVPGPSLPTRRPCHAGARGGSSVGRTIFRDVFKWYPPLTQLGGAWRKARQLRRRGVGPERVEVHCQVAASKVAGAGGVTDPDGGHLLQ